MDATIEEIKLALESPVTIRNLQVTVVTARCLPLIIKSFQAQWITGLDKHGLLQLRHSRPDVVAFSGSRKNFFRRDVLMEVSGLIRRRVEVKS